MLYSSNRASVCSRALIFLSPTRWIVMTGLRISISLQKFVQTRGSLLYTSISLHSVSNMFGLWLLVCVYSSVSSLSFKHVWMVIPCLSTSFSLLPCVSNTFVQTRLGSGPLSVFTHLSTAFCFKHVCLWLLVCLQASVFSQNGYGWYGSFNVNVWCSMLWEW